MHLAASYQRPDNADKLHGGAIPAYQGQWRQHGFYGKASQSIGMACATLYFTGAQVAFTCL